MYKIVFYKNKNNISELQEYIKELSNAKDSNKNSKIKFIKVTTYIDLLSQYGFNLGKPYIKHIEQDIWELRPLKDRIFFANIKNNEIILLNHFMKKTQKTPQREIKKAKKLLQEFKMRSDENEQ